MFHGTNTQTTDLTNVSVKLSDEILNLSCQLEQPACPMILCSFVCGWSCCPSPLCFQSDLSTASLRLRSAEILLRTLVQVGLGTLSPQLPESLHVSLLRFPGPRGVLLCQDVCHRVVCSELLRLRLRILEVQIDLLPAHNRCYCSYSASWNTAATGRCAGVPVAPTRPTSQSVCLQIRFKSTTSILLPMHVACRRALAVASATGAAKSAHPPNIDG